MVALVASLVVGVIAGCSSAGGVQTVTVSAKDLAFDAKELTVQKGQPVKLVFNNGDTQLHDFSVDKIPADVKTHTEGHDMGAKKPDLHVSADAGKSGTVEFTPKEAGIYTFYCTVAGHKDAGMVGKLIVK
jgi:uncharacterized cupredoxin-like copper-binding protein